VLEILSERLQARRSATAIGQANPLITMQMAASAVVLMFVGNMQYFTPPDDRGINFNS